MSSTSTTSIMESQNQAALDYFIQLPVSRDMICYLAKATSQVIRCDNPPQVLNKPTNTLTPPSSPSAADALPSLEEYITSIVTRSHVQVPTLMTSLVYLSRLQERLPAVAKGMACTLHRIFLAALILAAKNLNDSSPKNKHWARYTTVRGYPNFGFSITEVNLMEKQMLFLLDWDLRVRNEDLYQHLEPFLAPIRQSMAQQERIRQQQILEHQREQQAKAQRHYYSTYTIDTPVSLSSRPPSLSPSSRSSSVSSPDTANLDDLIESPVDESPSHNTFTQQDGETGEIMIHIQPREIPIKLPPINVSHVPHGLHRVRSYDDTKQQPSKKARIGGAPGSFLARLLNGTQTRVPAS